MINQYKTCLLSLVLFVTGCSINTVAILKKQEQLSLSSINTAAILKKQEQLSLSSSVYSVVFSPTGTHALSGGRGGTLKLWEISTGRLVRILKGHTDSVNSVAFSPGGQYVLSGSNDKTLKLWDIKTGYEIRSISGHSKAVTSVAFSPDGQYVLSGSRDETLKLWELSTGREIRSFHGHYRGINSVSFSPDSQYAFSSSRDKTFKLWEIDTGREVRASEVQIGGVHSISFSPNGQYVLSANEDNTLNLWNVSTGRKVRSFIGHSRGVESAAFSPDGQYVLSGSRDKTLKLWEVSTGREIRSIETKHASGISSVAFSPDAQYALSGSHDSSSLSLWDISTGREVRSFKRGPFQANFITISANGNYAIIQRKHVIELWDIYEGYRVRQLNSKGQYIEAASFSPDGKYIFFIRSKHLKNVKEISFKLWDIETGHEIKYNELSKNASYVDSALVSHSGKYALTYGTGTTKYRGARTLRLWDISTGREIISSQEVGSGHSFEVSPDNKYVAIASSSRLELMDVNTGQKLQTIKFNKKYSKNGHNSSVTSTAFSSDFRYALSGSWDRTLKLWDIRSGSVLREFNGHNGRILSVAFSPDGQFGISGSEDNTVRVWEISTGQEIQSFKGHSDILYSVGFSPNGKFAISGGRDSTAKVWSIETGEEVIQFLSNPDEEWLSITPDGYFRRSPEERDTLIYVTTPGFETYAPEQFESYYFRPDIIKSRLSGDFSAGKPTQRMVPPPKITMQDHQQIKHIKSPIYAIELTGSALKKIKTIRVFVNGKPTVEKKINSQKVQLSLDVPLFSGANRITVIAYDDNGFSSTPQYIDVISEQNKKTKPNLHILAIGISDYPKLSSSWQLDFAHTDAQALINTMTKQEGRLFNTVSSTILLNGQATPINIKNEIDKLSSISENDIVIIFMAGHGAKTKEDEFYFLTSTGSFNTPEVGGINWRMFSDKLSNINSRVLLFLDACHSGAISTETIAPNDELATKFFTREKGGVMVFSASKGRQSSLESPDIGGGFGFFTYALTQGLGEKSKNADKNGNGFVEFIELVNYVQQYVKTETEQQQVPWLSRQELFGDLPVAMVIDK